MNRKKTILMLSCLLVVIIGALVIFLLFTTNKTSNKEKYNKKISAANKYVQEEKWEDAIGAYLEAIEYDDSDEDAYYTLAQIYIYKNMMEDAEEILLKGIDITGSQKLKDLYDMYFITAASNTAIEKEDIQQLELNTSLLKQISKYTLEEYTSKYGSPSYNVQSDYCEVKHKNLAGVIFTYHNTDDNKKIIDSATGRPNEDKMPCEVSVEQLSTLFTGSEDKILYSDLESLSLKGLRISKSNEHGFYIVSFESSNCTVTIECDDNGDVALDAWNQIVPNEANMEAETEDNNAFEVSGKIVNATTGDGISRAMIYVRDRNVTRGVPIVEVETESDGTYVFDIEPGKYTAEIVREGFMTEYADFEVDKWGEADAIQFTISEQLNEGEIRIVLEWGEYPRDLDSHLQGRTSDGKNIHVYFGNKYENEANLDVDDTTSYGPETITITDINGEYNFYVYDYTQSGNIGSSQATVKVYLPDETSPRIYEVPAISGNTWQVFSIINGEIMHCTQ